MIIEYGPSANVSASETNYFWPNAGYKWKIVRISGYVVTSSTSGTRSVLADVMSGYVGGFPNATGITLLNFSSTTTSGTVAFTLDVSSNATNPLYFPPLISDADALKIDITLQTGDELYYIFTVEQEPQ